ncbi:MAG: hypothetical protein WKF63_02830 [Thermomicrobiales bacterium]
MSLVAIAMFIMLALSQGHIAPFERVLGPGYTLVAANGAYGIIIDERFAPRFLPPNEGRRVKTWTPTRQDVATAEMLLRPLRPADEGGANQPALKGIPEDLVSRTWFGAVVDGQRLLFVDGYCSGGIPARPLYPLRVEDGGACYWNATIDAETWEVIQYVENGEA